MPKKSLDELLASPMVGLPRAVYAACLATPLAVRVREIDAELAALPEPQDESAPKKRRRASDADPRAALEAERAQVVEQMSEHLVEVVLTAKSPAQWREWRTAHPARPDHGMDQYYGVDLNAVADALPEHVVTVNDEPLGPGQWDRLCSVMAPGDVDEMAALVAEIHKSVVDPKLLTGSAGTTSSASG